MAASTVAGPPVRRTITVPIHLPFKYTTANLPARPLDDKLVVGLILPEFDPLVSAKWTSPVETTYLGGQTLFAWIQPDIKAVELVYVDAAKPVAEALPKIFRRLFSRSKILKDAHCSDCDLVVTGRVGSQTLADSENHLRGVRVTIALTAVDASGTTLGTLIVSRDGHRTRSLYWSSSTEARAITTLAVVEALEAVVSEMVKSTEVKEYLQEKIAQRTRPSDLETSVTFDDASSYFPNGRLDAGESARLRFRITNRGSGKAFAVRLVIARQSGSINVPETIEVGDIAPGEAKHVDAPLSAAVDVETAQHLIRADTVEKRGYGGRPVVVELASASLRKPSLEIADIRLDDRVGGDGDGRPSNGETLEVVVLLRNSGPGEAVGAQLSISSAPGIEIADASTTSSAIPAGGVKTLRAVLRVPITFLGRDLPVVVQATETRGALVARAETERRWPLMAKNPQVEIGFRLFDGNSPQSRGNRDGIANNGENLEVALIPGNRGTLIARDVRLELTSPIAGLLVKPALLQVGDLPPLSEGAEHRVQVTIPRTLGRDEVLQRLSLSVNVLQTDFAAGRQMVALPFNAERPQLVAAVASQAPAIEGKQTRFALDIANDGALPAEDVRVEISSDNPDVELLDASGTPVRVLRMNIGAIAAKAAGQRIQLHAHIRRNVAAATALLKASVFQRDFGTVAAQAPLTILKEDPAAITTTPKTLAEPAISPVRGAPAAISFQRYPDGTRLAEEWIRLDFEVQSQTQLEMVRLEQNDRAIDLPPATTTGGGGTYVWHYAPRVQLEYGPNDLKVIAITSEGVRSSRSMTLHREKPRGKVWVAVVGVSNYRETSIVDLEFAKADAVAVRSHYRGLGVPADQVIELVDESATLANIKRILGTDLVKHANNPDDLVLIYFAGHGEMEADRSSADSDGYSKYLLPYDANREDLFGSALSMEELSRILQRLHAERVVLIIDSCFSGAAGGRTPYEPNITSRGVITDEFLARIASLGKGRVILTASGSREVARESNEHRHGVFTHFLLEGLRGAADIDRDGRIDVDEIYKYVSQKVSVATHGQQNPMRKSPNLTGTVVLGGRLE